MNTATAGPLSPGSRSGYVSLKPFDFALPPACAPVAALRARTRYLPASISGFERSLKRPKFLPLTWRTNGVFLITVSPLLPSLISTFWPPTNGVTLPIASTRSPTSTLPLLTPLSSSLIFAGAGPGDCGAASTATVAAACRHRPRRAAAAAAAPSAGAGPARPLRRVPATLQRHPTSNVERNFTAPLCQTRAASRALKSTSGG